MSSSLADLRPGDIGFGPLVGGLGSLAMWGQFILGQGFTVGRLKIGHVFVVTAVQGASIQVVEAMPGGARSLWTNGRWTPDYAYARLPEDYSGQAGDAAAIARAMIGTPYSFASYVALAAWRFGLKAKRLETWIDRRGEPMVVNSTALVLPREAICSVLADQAWALTGKQVMPAGTPHQCVTPGALADALLVKTGVTWLWPQSS